ncbi:MAG: response regulator [Candidatus Omnitrophica bacterium]|nr:response regulator [Candidatus Omnitrophota bacterium]
MKKAHIILIDDQIDVLSALLQDLKPFRERFILDDCQSADEAYELMEELEVSGEQIALIISDHIMANKNGIELYADLAHDQRFEDVRKILITGQASHEDTIDAINNASIDYYISKPWSIEELHKVVRKMITHWIFDHGLNHKDYEGMIDTDVLLKRSKAAGDR